MHTELGATSIRIHVHISSPPGDDAQELLYRREARHEGQSRHDRRQHPPEETAARHVNFNPAIVNS